MIDRLQNQVEMRQRHLEVLRTVVDEEPIGITNLSDVTGNRKHKVRYSLRMLEEEGILEPTSRGAVTTEDARDFLEEHNETLDETVERLEGMRMDPYPSD